MEIAKALPIDIRSLGFDETWLQEQILADPTLLGLGELEVFSREHRQPSGGRIDFLMHEAETESFYEVELMLGALDESHIIRTIEYWDLERARRPRFDHFAVIVAERITSRFFNVLRLLNRSVPLIAVQLSAFKIGDKVILHPVKVLDVIEEVSDTDLPEQTQTDRAYWQSRGMESSLALMDEVISKLNHASVETKLTYNKYHIAVRTLGNNFCWFHPRRTQNYCHVEVRLTSETRDVELAELQAKGFDASPRRADYVTISLNRSHLEANMDSFIDLLKRAEALTR